MKSAKELYIMRALDLYGAVFTSSVHMIEFYIWIIDITIILFITFWTIIGLSKGFVSELISLFCWIATAKFPFVDYFVVLIEPNYRYITIVLAW